MARNAEINRKTLETAILVKLNLDGGDISIDTGVGFFDHMMTLFASHGGFGLTIKAAGDTYIDDHHTVEDIGIALGKAFYDAAGDKKGINRYSNIMLPMDETLVEGALDFGGRFYLHFDANFIASKTGNFDLQLVEEFFRAFAQNAKVTLHLILRHGRNDHHIAEALFKATGRLLRHSLTVTSDKLPSTKGVLE